MTLDFLKKFNVPVLQAYTLLTPYENWRDDFEGMNAMEVSISVTMPEFDGAIHGVPIANKNYWKWRCTLSAYQRAHCAYGK